jgi:SAM-dependent methyltransferase
MPLYLEPDDLRAYRDLNAGPPAMLDLVGAMAFRAAGAALRLGVFEALAGGPRTAPALAAKLPAAAEPLAVLLDALARFGYLVRDGDRYALGPAASPWLDQGSAGGFAPALSLWHDLLGELWTGLEQAVRTGGPPEPYYPWLERRPGVSRDFQTMLAGMARALAPAVVAAAPAVRGRLLDLGGGHALYSLAFLRAEPRLSATVVDLPGALERGRAHVEEAGLGDRVTLRPADLLDELPDEAAGGHDAVLLFNVLHGFDAGDGAALVARAARALRPGGRLLVLEPFADPPEGTPGSAAAFLAGFSLNLAATQGGRLYAFAEIAAWAEAAGLRAAERLALDAPGTEELLVATREGGR